MKTVDIIWHEDKFMLVEEIITAVNKSSVQSDKQTSKAKRGEKKS